MPALSLIVPCSLRATLFPYTTLFRSRGAQARDLRPWKNVRRARSAARNRPCGRARRVHLGGGTERLRQDHVPAEDRKSTRLNSSHGYISYAVFCLKKKKEASAPARYQ